MELIWRLPTTAVQTGWTREQQQHHDHVQQYFRWTALRLDFLQLRQLEFQINPRDGSKLQDPLADPALHPKQQESIKVWADYLFAILGLLVCNPTAQEKGSGFSRMRDWAAETGREFPFQEPRQIIAEICRNNSEETIQGMLIDEGDSGNNLTNQRKSLRRESAILRSRTSSNSATYGVTDEDVQDWLLGCRTAAWHYFLISAIWDDRHRSPFRDFWKDFLQAHKAYVNYWCKPIKQGNTVLISPYWRGGKRFEPILYSAKNWTFLND
jgi:hypothetical protein